MSGFFQNLLNTGVDFLLNGTGGLPGPAVLRDYKHASKAFTYNGYQNTPKFKFLFHTYFNINAAISPITSGQPTPQASLNGYISPIGQSSLSTPNYGVMVKEVKLPSFSFNTVQLNQYNRKRIIQTKIKYDPIEIVFHDDNLNQINQMWQTYYNYYYNDGLMVDKNSSGSTVAPTGSTTYPNSRTVYAPSETLEQDNMWGFSGGQDNASEGKKSPFFNNITVFGFNQHRFTAYTFVNPIITAFQHDTYAYAEGGGTMQNRMTIDYETVIYNYGSIDGRDPGQIAQGFGDDATYDKQTSPIMNSLANGAALGLGGLIDAAGGFLGDGPGAGTPIGPLLAQSAAQYAFKSIGNETVGGALNAMFNEAMKSVPGNRNTPFTIPVAKATPGPIGTANSPVIGALTAPPSVAQDGVTSNYLDDMFAADALSTNIGLAADPTLQKQIQNTKSKTPVISFSDPTAQAQQAAYASPYGIYTPPSAIQQSGNFAEQASLAQLVAEGQQTQPYQIFGNTGYQYAGDDNPNGGDLPPGSDITFT